MAEATAQPGEGGAKAAEQALREYLEGANDRNQEIDRTTPLFRDSDGKLFFMLPGNQVRYLQLSMLQTLRPSPANNGPVLCQATCGVQATGGCK